MNPYHHNSTEFISHYKTKNLIRVHPRESAAKAVSVSYHRISRGKHAQNRQTKSSIPSQRSPLPRPRHPRGKSRALRKKAVKSLSQALLIEGESPADFRKLVEFFNESLHPETAMDHFMIGKMAASHWRQIRLWEQEKSGADTNLNDHEMRLDRQFCRIFDRYHKLKQLRHQPS